LSSKLQKHITDALQRLDNESVGDVKKLKGVEFYRLRVSNYRVIFKLEKKCFMLFESYQEVQLTRIYEKESSLLKLCVNVTAFNIHLTATLPSGTFLL